MFLWLFRDQSWYVIDRHLASKDNEFSARRFLDKFLAKQPRLTDDCCPTPAPRGEPLAVFSSSPFSLEALPWLTDFSGGS